jgi:hypothetical protein
MKVKMKLKNAKIFRLCFFTVVAAIGGSVSAGLSWATVTYPEWSIPSPWPYLTFAIFFGALLPGVFGFAFGNSVRGLRPLPAHLAGLAIGTFVFGTICLFTVNSLVTYRPIAQALEWRPENVLLPAIATLTTAMFYMSSAFVGHARRRQKAGEPSRTTHTTVSGGGDSVQPQSTRQQARVGPTDQTLTPRQQAMIGLIGTITAALIGLFGTLVTVFFSAG